MVPATTDCSQPEADITGCRPVVLQSLAPGGAQDSCPYLFRSDMAVTMLARCQYRHERPTEEEVPGCRAGRFC